MNERIKELAEQASLELFGDTAQYRLLLGFSEKFAELIVKECAVELMKLGNAYSESENDANYMQGMLDSAEIIREHFGVQ